MAVGKGLAGMEWSAKIRPFPADSPWNRSPTVDTVLHGLSPCAQPWEIVPGPVAAGGRAQKLSVALKNGNPIGVILLVYSLS